jgi:hypothetical protein
MKSITFFYTLLLSFFISNYSNAQTAVGGCNSVSLTSVPSYTGNLWLNAVWVCQSCGGQCFDQFNGPVPLDMVTRSWLQKKQTNGTFVNVQGGANGITGDNVVFNVTDPGVYRILNQRPSLLTTTACPSGRDIRNLLGQTTGKKRGLYASNSFGLLNSSSSNEVFVGAVQPNQVTYQFVDGGGGNSAQTGFDFNELVRINTTGCANFTSWWVAIFENDGPMRWNSIGWQTGPLPTLVNLTDVWKNGNGSWILKLTVPTRYNLLYLILAIVNGQIWIRHFSYVLQVQAVEK